MDEATAKELTAQLVVDEILAASIAPDQGTPHEGGRAPSVAVLPSHEVYDIRRTSAGCRA